MAPQFSPVYVQHYLYTPQQCPRKYYKSDQYPTPTLECFPLFHRRIRCTLLRQIWCSGDNTQINPTIAPLRQTLTSSPELKALLIMAIKICLWLPKLVVSQALISSGEGGWPCRRELHIEILTWMVCTLGTMEPYTHNDQAEQRWEAIMHANRWHLSFPWSIYNTIYIYHNDVWGNTTSLINIQHLPLKFFHYFTIISNALY